MSIRDLLTSHIHKSSPRAESVQAVNDALTSAPGALRLHFDESNGYTRIPEHPATQAVEYAMALIAEDTATLLSGEPADSLAICDAPSCDRLFLRTHARRQWCSTRCGDRVRAARAYSRRRDTSNPG